MRVADRLPDLTESGRPTAALGTSAAPRHDSPTHPPHTELHQRLVDDERVHEVTAVTIDGSPVAVRLTVRDPAGHILGRLSGDLPPEALATAARLLGSTLLGLAAAAPAAPPNPVQAWQSAASAEPTPVEPAASVAPGDGPASEDSGAEESPPSRLEKKRLKHPNHGHRWTAEDDESLSQQFEAGATIRRLCKEFGRNANAVRARLVRLGLLAAEEGRSWPDRDRASTPPLDTAEPEPPQADGSPAEKRSSIDGTEPEPLRDEVPPWLARSRRADLAPAGEPLPVGG
jgi:transposase-like protein